MVKIIDHPLIKHKLSILRDKKTSHLNFKIILHEITSLMIYEVFRNIPLKEKKISTPIIETIGYEIDEEIVVVPILRAGLGMVSAVENLIPQTRVGHIGVYRDETNFKINEYFYKMPQVKKDAYILLLDPMLATGCSANFAIQKLKNDGFTKIKLVSIVGVKEGINVIKTNHPDVEIFLSSQDKKLNHKKYIEPGLGDAGDRLFGTK